MKAGALDRRITIQDRVETQNSFGEAQISYNDVATVWAEVKPLTGREYFSAAQYVPEAKLKIRIRYRPGVTEKQRIMYQGETYDIGYIAEIGRREGLELIVKTP
jgi:SPP1 family predicted phage head-tail adaptor